MAGPENLLSATIKTMSPVLKYSTSYKNVLFHSTEGVFNHLTALNYMFKQII